MYSIIMPLVVNEQIEEDREHDYDPLLVIQYTAFSEEPVLLAMFPRGLESSMRAQNIATFKSGLGFGDPNVAAAKVVDSRTGEICAFATMRSVMDSSLVYPGISSSSRLR